METPFFCDLTALDARQRARHGVLAHGLRSAVLELEELVDGYALRFAPSDARILELAEFMTLEARCCPFLTLAVERAADGGPVRLRLTGRPGVKPFLRAELGMG